MGSPPNKALQLTRNGAAAGWPSSLWLLTKRPLTCPSAPLSNEPPPNMALQLTRTPSSQLAWEGAWRRPLGWGYAPVSEVRAAERRIR